MGAHADDTAHHGQLISDLIKEHEKTPRRAAALARARMKLAGIVGDGTVSIASLRLAKGLSQKQLAERMGASQPYIARLERGEDVRITTIRNLAVALGEPVAKVFAALDDTLGVKD